MSTISIQPQFRYTQPPSKVLHLRNLPYDCAEEDLVDLGRLFGRIINTKCNVGANRNQAFVEFETINQAIAMISYYASSSDPAQIRGKTVYLQYSNRQEITNNKSNGDVASNVLLVSVEGVEAGDISIDVLHLVWKLANCSYYNYREEIFIWYMMAHVTSMSGVPSDPSTYLQSKMFRDLMLLVVQVFSAFGFVHKIATFEKTAGFQALVQFSDLTTATSARDSLDGRSIPRYLLQEHLGPCTLRITFSAHTDLNVKFQSHRSRDYTNPYLPVAPSAIDGSGQIEGSDGTKQEPESNVLLVSIMNMQYDVTVDVLHTVFSNFGTVQKIAIFEKKGFQALIQYPDVQTAVVAKQALEGHCIYDGGFCKLHLTYSCHTNLSVTINNDRGRDYTSSNTLPLSLSNNQPSILGQQPGLIPSASYQQHQVYPNPSPWVQQIPSYNMGAYITPSQFDGPMPSPPLQPGGWATPPGVNPNMLNLPGQPFSMPKPNMRHY